MFRCLILREMGLKINTPAAVLARSPSLSLGEVHDAAPRKEVLH